MPAPLPHTTSLLRRSTLLLLLWITGLYLRIPILVAPPLAPVIGDDLALSQATIGSLTTLPVLMLALGALPGALAIARLGARHTLIIALLVVAAGSAARALAPPTTVLLLATCVLGLGVAAMQPALPALLPRWCPGFMALGSAVYMNGMLMGEFVGAGLTLPVMMPLTGGSWRLTLLAWAVPAAVIAVALLIPRDARPASKQTVAWQPDWRDGNVWRLGLLLGAASTSFFGTNAYMGSILAQRGELATLASALFLFNASQVVASVVMLFLSRRLLGRRGPLLGTGMTCALGLLGFSLLDGSLAVAAAVLIGLASAAQLILLVSLPPQIAAAGETGSLSAGMFTLGYTVAFAVPLLGGVIADYAGDATMAMTPITLYALAAVPLVRRLRLAPPAAGAPAA